MNQLVIFWGNKTDSTFRWYLQSKTDSMTSIASGMPETCELLKADLGLLAGASLNARVTLVLSSDEVFCTQIKMPKSATRHLRKAVPYQIEEQLAEPLDEVFVAIGERNSGEVPVRAVNRDYFCDLLAQIKQAEILLAQVVLDLDLIEQPSLGGQLALMGDNALYADEQGQRWSCRGADFSWLIQKQLAQSADEAELPIAIPLALLGDNADALDRLQKNLPVGRFAPDVTLVDSVEQHLTDTLAAQTLSSATNFLQGEFEVKNKSSQQASLIKKVALVALLLLSAHLVYQGSQLFVLSQQKSHLGKQKTALWKQAFPGRRVPANQDKVLRSYLKGLGSTSSESSFLSMLESTATRMGDLQKLYPTNISFDAARNELRVDLIAKDLPILNQYRDDLKQNGYQVEMSSATQRGDGYSSRLIIRR